MVILIFSIAACSAVYASYSTCYTDPADDALVFKPYDTANNSRVNTAFGGLGALQFCQSCVSQSATSPAVTDSVDGANNTTSSKSYLPVDTNVIFCYICEAHVHMSAKHCRYCDKCVGE